MLKNITTLKGAKSLTKREQKTITGGFFGFGCQAQLLECYSDQDCPSCSSGCGVTIDFGNGNTETFNICAF